MVYDLMVLQSEELKGYFYLRKTFLKHTEVGGNTGSHKDIMLSEIKQVTRKHLLYDSTGFPVGSDSKESACNAGDPGSISQGQGRSPGKGNGNPLQHSCLENSTYRGVWWAVADGVKESDTTDTLALSPTYSNSSVTESRIVVSRSWEQEGISTRFVQWV